MSAQEFPSYLFSLRVPWAQLLDYGSSNASLVPVKNSVISQAFSKPPSHSTLCRPARYSRIPIFIHFTFIICLLWRLHLARLAGLEYWRLFHKGADHAVRWFVPDSTASWGQAEGGPGLSEPASSSVPAPFLALLDSGSHWNQRLDSHLMCFLLFKEWDTTLSGPNLFAIEVEQLRLARHWS